MKDRKHERDIKSPIDKNINHELDETSEVIENFFIEQQQESDVLAGEQSSINKNLLDSRKSKLVNFSKASTVALLGTITGALFIIILVTSIIITITLNSIGLDNIGKNMAIINTIMKIMPWIYYLALILGIISFVLSILNDIHYKDLKVIISSYIFGLSCILMLMNFKFMNGMRIFMTIDFYDLMSGKTSLGALSDISAFSENEDFTIKFKIMVFIGIIVFGYSLYLLTIFSKYEQINYETISLEAFKRYTNLENIKAKDVNPNQDLVNTDSTERIKVSSVEKEHECTTTDNTKNNFESTTTSLNQSEKKTSDCVNEYKIPNATHSHKKKAFTKKTKIAISIVIFLIAFSGGSYFIWNTFFNFTKIDLASNIKLTYDGISEDAYITNIKNNIKYDKNDKNISDFINGIRYDYSKSERLKNGDKITVTVLYNKATAKKLKLKIIKSSTKIKVKNLPYRFNDADDISFEIAQLVKKKGEYELNEYNKNEIYYTYNFSYQGTYFLKLEESDVLVAVFKDYHVEKDADGVSSSPTHFYIYAIKNVDSELSKGTIDSSKYVKFMEILDKSGEYVTNESEIVPALSTWYREPVKNVTKLK